MRFSCLMGSRPRNAAHRRPRVRPIDIDGLLLDAGDVLFDATAWPLWMWGHLRHFDHEASFAEFACRFRREYAVDAFLGRCSYWTALARYLADAGLTGGDVEEALAAGRSRRPLFDRHPHALPGVVATVRKLSARRIRLGVLTNSERSRDQLGGELEHCGLGGCFDVIHTSRETGRLLPLEEAYLDAADALDVERARTAFVGHDAVEIAGARAAGMIAIGINLTDNDAAPDVRLDSFDELDAVVAPTAAYSHRAAA